MSSSSFRQRQVRARKIEARVVREKERIDHVQQGASSLMGNIYACILVALLLIVIGVLSKIRPELLPWNKPAIPRLTLGMLFPVHISPEKDLVPVVNNYVICTPDNLQSRNAVRYIIQQRENLKSRAIKVALYPQEHDQVQTFAHTTALCGDNFEEYFLESPPFLQNDLFLWCKLRESRVQGIVEYGIDFHRPLRAFQNLAVLDAGHDQRRILSSLLISASDSIVPSKMFEWLLSANENQWNASEYRDRMENRLFEIIQNDEQGKWTLIDAVCGEEHRPSARRKYVF